MPRQLSSKETTILRALPGLLLCLLLAACASSNGALATSSPLPLRDDWGKALRALDPPDAVTPAHDLTAAYLRLQDESVQIRIDLLAFQNADDLSLDIGIGDDTHPQAAPLLIHIPAQADSARIFLDPALATVTLTLPRSQVPARPRLDVTTPEDALTGLTLDGPVPAQTAPVLLTFYDTFAARFPAEALRRWDGAHSGPRGERHGLKHLLDAVEKYRIPVALLDLKTPKNLSALDAMGLLPRIQQMEQEGLLLLPDQAGQKALFDLPTSPFSWDQAETHPFVFARLDESNHLYRPLLSKTTFIPIAIQNNEDQPTPNGLSLTMRRALLESALNEDEIDLLVLGGSLQETTWGSPERVDATMAWLDSRPYIHILTATDLLNCPTKSRQPNILPLPRNESLAQLEAHYHRLTEPVLQFAAHWQGAPLAGCGADLDEDGEAECTLANGDFLAILDPQGARLTYLFWRAGNENASTVQQLIGPCWQAAVGLSASSRWDLSKGEATDPGACPGAFTDLDNPFLAYQPVIAADTLMFTSLDGARLKTFRLTQTGLEVSYQVQTPLKTQIPLLVAPETRFTPGWAGNYARQVDTGSVAWGLAEGPLVRIQAQSPMTMRAFDEALPFLAAPEDPDFSYPAGHFVPFPIAIVDVEIMPNAAISVVVQPP